jgi:ATP-binding protein involved in chromosome partitioning
VDVPILGVVENMSWFTPKELPDNKYFIFGQGGGAKLAEMAQTKLLGQVPLVQGIRESGDLGKPAVLQDSDANTRNAFMTVAENALAQIRERNKKMAPTRIVEVK